MLLIVFRFLTLVGIGFNLADDSVFRSPEFITGCLANRLCWLWAWIN